MRSSTDPSLVTRLSDVRRPQGPAARQTSPCGSLRRCGSAPGPQPSCASCAPRRCARPGSPRSRTRGRSRCRRRPESPRNLPSPYVFIYAQFVRYPNVAKPPPGVRSVEQLKEAAASCQACDLWENATQTVFGEGSEHAPMMLVGEQPGDQEDLQGKPFVGPAGRLLERALEEAGIDRRRGFFPHPRQPLPGAAPRHGPPAGKPKGGPDPAFRPLPGGGDPSGEPPGASVRGGSRGVTSSGRWSAATPPRKAACSA